MSGARCPGWLWSRAGGPSLAAPPGHSSGLVVETEPLHQYFITFCCYVTNGSRWTVWHSDIWHGRVCETKVWNWIPSWKKIAPSGIHWCFLNIYGTQTVNVNTGNGCIWAVVSGTWKTSHVPGSHPQLSHHEMKSVLTSTSALIHRLWPWTCVQSINTNSLETMTATLGYRKVCATWMPQILTYEWTVQLSSCSMINIRPYNGSKTMENIAGLSYFSPNIVQISYVLTFHLFRLM